jgi:hypothetical protein
MWSRALLVAAAVVTASAAPARGNPDDPDRALSAKEVAKYFAPYAPAVRDCYLTTTRGKQVSGVLRLELIIHHDGYIFRFGFAAPSLDEATHAKLDRCLRGLAKTWHMPARKGFTSAVIPFVYLKTSVPGGGPQESCWDARGCPPGKSGGSG